MQGIGLPDIAQAAASKICPTYRIVAQAGGGVSIRHTSELGTKERILRPGVEINETNKDGSTVKIVLDAPVYANVLTCRAEWSTRGRIVDTRTLLEDSAGGLVIHQHIDFSHESGKHTASERYFLRVGDAGE